MSSSSVRELLALSSIVLKGRAPPLLAVVSETSTVAGLSFSSCGGQNAQAKATNKSSYGHLEGRFLLCANTRPLARETHMVGEGGPGPSRLLPRRDILATGPTFRLNTDSTRTRRSWREVSREPAQNQRKHRPHENLCISAKNIAQEQIYIVGAKTIPPCILSTEKLSGIKPSKGTQRDAHQRL